jgi:hypothetical protein
MAAVFLSAAPARADEVGEVREEMDAEFDRIESDLHSAVKSERTGLMGAALTAFEASFGLPGYNRVTEMLRRNRLVADIAHMVQEVRLMYADRGYGYVDMRTLLETMHNRGPVMANPYGGRYVVGPAAGGVLFCIQANGIGARDCEYLAGYRWEGSWSSDGRRRLDRAVVARGDFEEWRPPSKVEECDLGEDAKNTLYFCYR